MLLHIKDVEKFFYSLGYSVLIERFAFLFIVILAPNLTRSFDLCSFYFFLHCDACIKIVRDFLQTLQQGRKDGSVDGTNCLGTCRASVSCHQCPYIVSGKS